MPSLIAVPDKFRGTASAAEVVAALGAAAEAAGWTWTGKPLADGGEGTLEALGGANRTSVVTGPLGDPVRAAWRLHAGTAVIEMARASGLAIAGGPEGNDPMSATTAGTGELIGQAIDAGAHRVIVTLGGSATTDGGYGAIEALHPLHRLRGVELIVACDVQTRFADAAETFGPQKGASPAQVKLLRRRLERLAQVYGDRYGVDVSAVPGCGAAGGLAGALVALGGELVGGFDLVADEVGLDELILGADLVVTGEGFFDQQSFEGKVVGGVLGRAATHGRPAIVVCGQCEDALDVEVPVLALVESVGTQRAFADTAAAITETVAAYLAALR